MPYTSQLMVLPHMLLCAQTHQAYGVASIIACARDALPFIQQLPAFLASPVAAGSSYVVSCLLCEKSDLHYPVQDALHTIQEHVMTQHGLSQEDLHHAVRINREADNACYIWGLVPERASALGLRSLSYMRADKRTDGGSTEDGANQQVLTLTFAPSQALPALHHVEIVKTDDHAWYGYPRTGVRVYDGEPIIYARDIWSVWSNPISPAEGIG